MTPPRSIRERVSAAIDRGAVVLTSNERSARTLRQTLATQLQGPQQILTLSAWASLQWQLRLAQGLVSLVPLTTTQEIRLWEQIVASDERVQTLASHRSLAELAHSANTLLARWDARPLMERYTGSSDTRSFRNWLTSFEHTCRQEGWISSASLHQALAESIRSGSVIPPPQTLALVGFDQMFPAQQRLLDALTHAGTEIESITQDETAADRSLLAANDSEAEFAQCAAWAGQQAREGRRVAVIHHDPSGIEHDIERALRTHADPSSNDVRNNVFALPYEFTLGAPMIAVPMVNQALQALQLLFDSLNISSASEILRSRDFFSLDSIIDRAEFDAFSLRTDESLRAEVTVELLIDLLSGQRSGNLRWPRLQHMSQQLRDAARILRRNGHHAGWEDWAVAIREALHALGFNTEAGTTSFEFQVQRRWNEVLDEMSRLQIIDREVPWTTAIDTLRQMCQSTAFALESNDAPIQIMTPGEAAGSEWDAIWILGADDSAWPPPVLSHPLLPFSLQAAAQMPGTSWQQSAESSSRAVARLFSSAPAITVSYSRTSTKGEHARLSSLFSAYSFSNAETLPLEDWSPVPLVAADNQAPLPALQDAEVRGGARVLELQAACSFRAFAELRLFASVPGESADGLDARARGVKLHAVLERFWELVASKKALADISAPDSDTGVIRRQSMLEGIVDDVLRGERHSPWEERYVDLERQRILALANRWLDYELTRPYDFGIEHVEQQRSGVPIGPLRLNLRVDRIDRVKTPSGVEGLVLIDYKTSAHKPGKWDGDRPDQPQLPLYAAVLDADDLLGIAFANVTPGTKDFGLIGLGDSAEVFGPRNVTATRDQLPIWQSTLEALADGFASGHPLVDPKRPNSTCLLCDQKILCRIQNVQTDAADDDEAEDASE